MTISKQRTVVAGSDKKMLPQARLVGKVDPKQQLEITVLLRPRKNVDSARQAMRLGYQLPAHRKYLTRRQLAEAHGADPRDVAQLDAFAHAHGLTITLTHLERRTVRLSGSVAALTRAFRPNLKNYRLGSRVFRGRTGPLSVPKPLGKIVQGIFGFDDRPVAKPHYRRRGALAKSGKFSSRNAADGSFTPPQVAALYEFPAGLDGSGQCIALIELNDMDKNGKVVGTGYSAADLQTYLQKLKIPLPQVTAVGVGGGQNAPGLDPNSDGEVMLDIEVAGAVAPGASIAVYFAPNTDQGFLEAVQAALQDDVRKPSVISISWGSSEDSWTDQFRKAFDQAFQDAARLGVTVCVAAGDNGSADQPAADRDGRPHVDFPAASPFVLACGGTKLLGSGTQITSETVWNEGDSGGAGGGGVSNYFAQPSYQAKVGVPRSPAGKTGRGVPDVAGDADPQTGYQVRTGGQDGVIGGTSAVAPLMAGLTALMNQRLAKLGKPTAGFMNPLLYNNPTNFRDIVDGNNDIDGTLRKYQAGPGWDACSGLGSPLGSQLTQTMSG